MRGLKILAITLATGGLLLAPNATAKASTADDIYLMTLDEYSVPYDSKGQAVAEGLQACAILDETNNLVAAGEHVMVQDPNLSLIQTARLVGAAVGAYCPNHDNLYHQGM